ncbi:MAG TPA: DNA polymerase I, partial [Planctomycetaceae bacterium]|nr:DNA polymerase I [Planctomycetaceae bacterium]
MPESVYLIDTFSLMFQVFHGVPPMTGPSGQPTNAIFGISRDLVGLFTNHRPAWLIAAWDSSEPSFRNTVYADYKANRSETPADLIPQISRVREVIEAFGIPVIEHAGWEADDVIATLAGQAAARGDTVRIITSDKDARQLLGPNVQLFNLRKNTSLGEAELLLDWGIRPDQVVDFQALVGDAVDNIPGVPLIGPKKAAQLLNQFGTLDEVLAHADEAPGAKLKENLKTYAEQARISRELARLKTDLPMEFDWPATRNPQPDVLRLQQLFREFGFRKLIDDVRPFAPAAPVPTKKSLAASQTKSLFGDDDAVVVTETLEVVVVTVEPKHTWQVIDTPELLAEFVATLSDPLTGPLAPASGERARVRGPNASQDANTSHSQSASTGERSPPHPDPLPRSGGEGAGEGSQPQMRLCLDLETTSVDPRRAEIVGWAFSWQSGQGYYLPVQGPPESRLLDATAVIAALKPILENAAVEVVNQNIKYDLIVLRCAGINIASLGVDPMVGDYLLDAGARSHGLEALMDKYLHRQGVSISDLIGTGKKQKSMADVPIDKIAEYATEDADCALQIADVITPQLKDAGLWDLYWNLERPLIPVLAELEYNGIRVDADELRRQSADLTEQLQRLMGEIHEIAGETFNIDSPVQLRKILFDKLGLPVKRKTKTGPSTDQEVLEELAVLHPLPAKITEHRHLSKLKGTYLDSLPELIHPQTGRIHCSFNQVVAATGRLSSSDPNLQNIPIRTPEGRRIRKAFVPGQPGWKLVCADYSQIELRMLAHFCGDPVLLEAFASGIDIHTAVAAQVYGVELAAVDADMRRVAKAVNFGVIYGQSPFGLAAALGIPQEDAAKFINEYFTKYAGVDRYLEEILAECKRTGYARTILGRRRKIEGIRPDR